MSKRTKTDSAEINAKNFWPTHKPAADPLAAVLPPFTQYDEPCCGALDLVRHLGAWGHTCVQASDKEPPHPWTMQADAALLPLTGRMIITNPPFAEKLLVPLLDHWIGSALVWLLLPTDMISNLYMMPFVGHIDRMIPLGRVSWLDNGKGGYENYAWYRFQPHHVGLVLPRTPKR